MANADGAGTGEAPRESPGAADRAALRALRGTWKGGDGTDALLAERRRERELEERKVARWLAPRPR